MKDLSVSAEEIPVEQKIFNSAWKILTEYVGIKASDGERIPLLISECKNLFSLGKDNFYACDFGKFLAATIIRYYRTVICSGIDNSDLSAEKEIMTTCWSLIKTFNHISVSDEEEWEAVFAVVDKIIEIGKTGSACTYYFAMDMVKTTTEYLDDHGKPQDVVIEARKRRLPYLKKLCIAAAA